MKNKILSLLLLLSLAFSMFATACDGGEQPPAGGGGENPPAGGGTSTETPLDPVDYVSGLKLDMNSETLKVEATVKMYIDGDTTHFYVPATVSSTGVLKARYIGINVKKVIIRTVLISGALCGVMGWILAAGTAHSITANSVGGNGFTAIMISWMSKFNPVVMVFSSLLVCFLQRGAGEIASSLRLNSSVGEVLTGVIILFIISSEFFINYKINFRHKKQKEETK